MEHEISADGYQVDQPGYSADPVYEFISKHNGQNQDSGENEETKQSIAGLEKQKKIRHIFVTMKKQDLRKTVKICMIWNML